MIDINKLRRLAQAATPGPWYVTGKLTRYVEARIDGGLIQEVAACGPTNADGGYGPQQEANVRLIAAANPATISELMDRLEAAEKDVALKERIIDSLGSELNAVAKERDELRTRIEQMERQEPVAYQHKVPCVNLRGDLIGYSGWQDGKGLYKWPTRALYALPGAKGE